MLEGNQALAVFLLHLLGKEVGGSVDRVFSYAVMDWDVLMGVGRKIG